ncbi:MAG: DUF423 domain-containing protein [Candidatus Caenarcaniphilales bacterium]|nr:DUF423 domain-containing protein [Candidatus Caenarcaniphilales bacterium]
MFWLRVAAGKGMILLILGAFGGHLCKNLLSAEMYAYYELGLCYGFYHLSALLTIGTLRKFGQNSINPTPQEKIRNSLDWSGIFLQ